MKIALESLTIQNFKGIDQLEIDFNGNDASIYGRNATGKTTIFDAFLWALFSKDSADRSDFWVKPHDANGEEIHNLETVVTVALILGDRKRMVFRHMLSENWVKKNGEADRVFSGNTHKYWLNDVSKSAAEYAAAVTEIVKPELFRLIANPLAFNALDWKKRREFLLALSPVDIDAAMLARPEYQPIREAMENRGTDIEGLKKIAREQKSRDDDELAKIPVRISELSSILNGIGDCDTEAADRRKAEIATEIAKIDGELSDGSGVIERIKEAASAVSIAELKVQGARSDLLRARMNARSAAQTELISAKTKLNSMKIAVNDLNDRINRATGRIADLDTQASALREQWYKIDEQAPEYKGSTDCPTCGQHLPSDMIEEAIRLHKSNFEADKERRLADIEKRGANIAAEVGRLKEQQSKDNVEREKLVATIAEIEPKIAGLDAEAKALEGEPDYAKEDKIKALEAELAAKRSEYEEAVSGKKPVDEMLVQRRKDLQAELSGLAAVAVRKQQKEVCSTRIKELEARQRALGIQIADTERFLILLDRFVAERSRMLEDSINSLFPTVRWSLFERQINGGLKEVCTCLVGGVQFSDANDAAKINAGLEIIEVLSNHYGVSVPVFVDNAESINDLQRISSQIVALFVTEGDMVLRIESGIKEKEVA